MPLSAVACDCVRACVGKEGRRISEENAYSHIAGLTIMNEGTLRDWVRHAKFNVTQGKNFVSSGSIGPWMVSADEFNGFNPRPREGATIRADMVRVSMPSFNPVAPSRGRGLKLALIIR